MTDDERWQRPRRSTLNPQLSSGLQPYQMGDDVAGLVLVERQVRTHQLSVGVVGMLAAGAGAEEGDLVEEVPVMLAAELGRTEGAVALGVFAVTSGALLIVERRAPDRIAGGRRRHGRRLAGCEKLD